MAGTALLACPASAAIPLDSSDWLRLTWTNDLSLSGVQQIDRSAIFAPFATKRYDDLTGRADWITAVEADHGDFGMRVSGLLAAGDLYDVHPHDEVLGIGQLPGATPYVFAEPPAVRHQEFELLDGFVHGTTRFEDGEELSFRLGRHALVWGESLYYATNGIAGAQSPIDVIRTPLDNYASRDVFLPVAQASASWQATPDLEIALYDQFEYRESRYSAVPAYGPDIARLDPVGSGLYTSYYGGASIAYFGEGREIGPDGSDQYGIAVRSSLGSFDAGLYALRFDAKTPILLLRPARGEGDYDLLYPSGAELYGVSLGGALGDGNFGAEISARRHMPLLTAGVVEPYGTPMAYPQGDTLHAQFSWRSVTRPLPLVPAGANWTGEIAFNHLIAASDAPQILPGRTRDAAGITTIFEPRFFQIRPRFDLSLPLSISYGLFGRSSVDPSMTNGTGDVSAGAILTFEGVWKATIEATHYIGRNRIVDLPYGVTPGANPLGNGDFMTLRVARSL